MGPKMRAKEGGVGKRKSDEKKDETQDSRSVYPVPDIRRHSVRTTSSPSVPHRVPHKNLITVVDSEYSLIRLRMQHVLMCMCVCV